jgi:Flp pilus assembly pilin Flp
MRRLASLVRAFVGEEEGIAVTEYAILLAVLAVALVAVVAHYGSTIATWFKAASGTVTSASA